MMPRSDSAQLAWKSAIRIKQRAAAQQRDIGVCFIEEGRKSTRTSCGWRIDSYATIGTWNRPRHWCCQAHSSSKAGAVAPRSPDAPTAAYLPGDGNLIFGATSLAISSSDWNHTVGSS